MFSFAILLLEEKKRSTIKYPVLELTFQGNTFFLLSCHSLHSIYYCRKYFHLHFCSKKSRAGENNGLSSLLDIGQILTEWGRKYCTFFCPEPIQQQYNSDYYILLCSTTAFLNGNKKKPIPFCSRYCYILFWNCDWWRLHFRVTEADLFS